MDVAFYVDTHDGFISILCNSFICCCLYQETLVASRIIGVAAMNEKVMSEQIVAEVKHTYQTETFHHLNELHVKSSPSNKKSG